MAKLNPFKAFRPTRDKVQLVTTRPFFSYKKNVLKAKLETNCFSFLHIINPEFGFSKKERESVTLPQRYHLAKEKYQEFLNDGILVQDPEPHFYLYRQIVDGHSFVGVVAGASVEEYRQGKIKIHEATISSRERMFTDYIDIVGFNAEPVLMSHESNPELGKIYAEVMSHRAEYEFTTTDRIKHEMWILDMDQTKAVQDIFSQIDELYIADGHHRSASSALLHENRLTRGESFLNDAFFLVYLIDEQELKIHEFNRVVKLPEGMTKEFLLAELAQKFEIEKLPELRISKSVHEMVLTLDDEAYSLVCKPEIVDNSHPVNCLDAEILTRYVLSPILGIHDLKTDENIEFVPGVLGLNKLQKKMEKDGFDAAFILHPVTMQEVKKVADNNMIMPPKSTWVEPKLRSGMTIYHLNE